MGGTLLGLVLTPIGAAAAVAELPLRARAGAKVLAVLTVGAATFGAIARVHRSVGAPTA